jgi:hypothetical protein
MELWILSHPKIHEQCVESENDCRDEVYPQLWRYDETKRFLVQSKEIHAEHTLLYLVNCGLDYMVHRCLPTVRSVQGR